MQRRQFLQSSALAAATLVVGQPVQTIQAEEAPETRAVVKRYRNLGKTSISMSDVSFGAGHVPSGSLILRAIDRGINYFDTAPDYGPSEDHFGEAMKKIKNRDKITIASKFCRPVPYQEGVSHLQPGSSVSDYVGSVENSLKRMGTDYLDVVFVHAMGEKNDLENEKRRLLDDNMLTAVDQLKKAGKIKYLAVSSHGPHNMEPLMLEAINSGHFDLMMIAFNFMKFPKIPDVLLKAKEKGVGVIAMKTLAGAKDSGAKLEAGQFEQAALKWVLQHEEIAGLVITFKSAQDLDLYLPASGQTFTAKDQHALDQYAALHNSSYCRTGCGDCLGACPDNVNVAAILRYNMYFKEYGEQKRAMESYASLEQSAKPCLSCSTSACIGACPYGLSVASQLQEAHRNLTWSAVA